MILFFCTGVNAQSKKAAAKTTPKTVAKKVTVNYPETFTIAKADFDSFFNYRVNGVIKTPSNQYTDKAVLLLNSKNGDMQLLRLKLSYFPKSYLMIQVNGVHSTQVFLMSDDKSAFYKGKVNKEKVTLTKCKEEEIVSE